MLTLKCWGKISKELAGPAESAGVEPVGREIGREVSRGGSVSRALKSQKLWLSLTYLGLILLMARTYA